MTDTLARCRDAALAGFTRVPITRAVVLDGDTPVSAFAKLHRGEYGFLLESLEGGERWARYSFLATEPEAIFRYRGTVAEQWTAGGQWTTLAGATPPLGHLGALLRDDHAMPVEGLPRFTGGAVGFWGYDIVRGIEHLPDAPPDDRDLPDAVAMVVDTLLVLDNLFHRAIVIANVTVSPALSDEVLRERIAAAEARIGEWIARLGAAGTMQPLHPTVPPPLTLAAPYADEAYRRDVLRCKEYIAAGDAFQIVLSRRMDLAPAPDPFLTYRWLRALNPAPYCYYLALGPIQIAGASPEVLVRVEQGEVTVRPIAGTRPRGRDAAHDLALEAELRADAKECAEHLMLVDLARNDVGRVAEYGSVRVVQQMVVERYSRVMHLVSEVRGQLRPELDALDALAATFPAGTVSGAPKVRAMQIIDSLEPTRRGPYAGAVGYVGYGVRTLDTAIAIRTVVFANGSAHVQAGAGIVADSVPQAEFEETEAKAGAVVMALALASRES
ncbi:MAG TPA: anthranilate synthase component I family protein [Gemmatimonadales bacterium]|nr:anthranilate synthase component I family protein [Gemmatimonadales bacterium]